MLYLYEYMVFLMRQQTTVNLVPQDISASASRGEMDEVGSGRHNVVSDQVVDTVPGSQVRGNVAEHHTATITWLNGNGSE